MREAAGRNEAWHGATATTRIVIQEALNWEERGLVEKVSDDQ